MTKVYIPSIINTDFILWHTQFSLFWPLKAGLELARFEQYCLAPVDFGNFTTLRSLIQGEALIKG